MTILMSLQALVGSSFSFVSPSRSRIVSTVASTGTVPSTGSKTTMTNHYHYGLARPSKSLYMTGPFFGPEEEFECPEEEECEIDWDKMPTWEDDNETEGEEETTSATTTTTTTTSSSSSSSKHEQKSSKKKKKSSSSRRTTVGRRRQQQEEQQKVMEPFEKSRVRLEMNWQIDECSSDADACDDFCVECAGTGRQVCRFCRGTRMIAFGHNDIRPCIVCHDGYEPCPHCKGTGRIAPWATTMDNFINDPENLKN